MSEPDNALTNAHQSLDSQLFTDDLLPAYTEALRMVHHLGALNEAVWEWNEWKATGKPPHEWDDWYPLCIAESFVEQSVEWVRNSADGIYTSLIKVHWALAAARPMPAWVGTFKDSSATSALSNALDHLFSALAWDSPWKDSAQLLQKEWQKRSVSNGLEWFRAKHPTPWLGDSKSESETFSSAVFLEASSDENLEEWSTWISECLKGFDKTGTFAELKFEFARATAFRLTSGAHQKVSLGVEAPVTPQGMTKVAQAIALISTHPTLKNEEVAERIGCSANYLSQSPQFKAARKAIKESGMSEQRHDKKDRGQKTEDYED